MAEVNSCNNVFSHHCPQFQFETQHIIGAIVGAIVVALGFILKYYAGVNEIAMWSMLGAGSLILVIDVALARKGKVVEVPPTQPPRGVKPEYQPPAEVPPELPTVAQVVSQAEPSASNPYDELAIAIDTGTVDEIKQKIAQYANVADLFTKKSAGKTALLRALCNFENIKSAENYLKLRALLDAGNQPNLVGGLTPFVYVCRMVIRSSKGVAIESTPEERVLLAALRPADDVSLKFAVDSLKPQFKRSQLKLIADDLFVFVKQLKG